MSEVTAEPTPKPAPEPDLRSELSKAEVEPLLPIELKLIRWSLGVGVGLLVILAIVNHLVPAG